MTDDSLPGALAGLRVIEWCDEKGAYAGKLLADMGADVIKVEPLHGDPTRQYAPFADDQPHPERSLWWWQYNTSKRGITLNLEVERGRQLFQELVATADVVIESRPPGEMAAWGIDYGDLKPRNASLIWVAITPFGRDGSRAHEEATDLTLLAGGGPVWMNGYDDHSLPPVRGGGNQGYHTGCHYAFLTLLVALLHRDETGEGEFIDVNMHAAANVTTEAGSYEWLVRQRTVQRQTGRHAAANPTIPTQVRCADGVYINTGIAPRRPHEFRRIHDWLEDLCLLDQFDAAPILLVAAEGEEIPPGRIYDDEEAAAKVTAGREGINVIAANLTAGEFFSQGQARGFQFGIVYAPEEMMEDRHFIARGFPVEVEHPELGRAFRYPGAPYRFQRSPWRIAGRAPLLGEDNGAVYGELGLSDQDLAQLKADGVI